MLLNIFLNAVQINKSYKNDRKISVELNENLGKFYIEGNINKDVGIKYLKNAEKLNSKNYFVYYYLSCYYSSKREKVKAINYINKAFYNIVSDYNKYNYFSKKHNYDFENAKIFINQQIKMIKSEKELKLIKKNNLIIGIIRNKEKFINAIENYYKAEKYFQNKEYTKALSLYISSKNNFKELNSDLLWISECYNKMGIIYEINNKYNEALSCYLAMQIIYKKVLGEEHLYTAINYNTIGYFYQILADYHEALVYFESALDLLTKMKNVHYSYIASIYDNIGSIYSINNEYETALEYFLKSKKIYEENHSSDAAVTYSNLGLLYHKIGKFDKAEYYYKEALKLFIYFYGENHINTGKVYNSIGMLKFDEGKYDTSLEYLFKAFDIFIKLTNKENSNTALSYNNIALVYNNIGNTDEALKYYIKSVKIRMNIFDEGHPDIAESYNNIGSIYDEKGEFETALNYYIKCYTIFKKIYGENDVKTANSLNNIGYIYIKMNIYVEAEKYLIKAAEIYKKVLGDDHPTTASVYNNLGGVYYKSENYDKAIHYYMLSLKIKKNNLHDIHPNLIESYHNIAGYYRIIGNNDSAKEYYLKAVNIIEKNRNTVSMDKEIKAKFLELRLSVYYSLINLLYDINEFEEAFYYCESIKSRSLLDEISMNIINKSKKIGKEYISKLNNIKSRMISYKKIISEKQSKKLNYDNEVIELNNIEKKYKVLLNEIYKKYPEYEELTKGKILKLHEVQKYLRKDEIIIEYMINDVEKGYVFIIEKDNYKMIKLNDKDLKNYKNYIKVFRDLMTKQSVIYYYYEDTGEILLDERGLKEKGKYEIISENKKLFKIVNQKLYNAFIKPVYKYLGSKNIILIPDRELAIIPFEALKDNNDKYLIENFNITYNQSSSVFVKSRLLKNESSFSILCLGGAKYEENNGKKRGNKNEEIVENNNVSKNQYNYYLNENNLKGLYLKRGYKWKNLPGTKKEVEEIGKLYYKNNKKFNDNILLGSNVTEDKINELNKAGILNKYKIIHFATHGLLDIEIPEMSAIVLSQIESLNEDGYLTLLEILELSLNSELVMLSACETGLGKIIIGEGITGLAQSFINVGSKNVCMTLWSIADESTKEFMINFYRKVIKGYDYKLALAETKREFINSKKWNKPFFWAPFVLYGE